ncbi:MAG TPA: endolytic transglycosylase MltG [Clostridia bacterium]|nr:endolytic transglycosylase MltG [Clostridia bacterium]
MRALLKLIFVALIAAMLWLAWAIFAPLRPDTTRYVLLRPGWSTRRIAQELGAAGVLRNRHAFLLAYYAGKRRTLKAGEYKFDEAENTLEVMDRLERGDVYVHTVVVPEGYNMFEIAQAVEQAGLGKAADFLAIARTETSLIQSVDPQAKSLEGYLFPDTYQFTRTQSLHDMAAAMVKRFQQEARAIGLTENVHQVVTLASIIEKETGVPEERPIVASVYYNRLGKRLGLAADPTVVYASLLDGRYRGTIYQSDLQADSPYNTYKFAGLPPGPIANPGRASLEAAMRPAQTEFLYFVAEGNGSGRHRFANSYEEHERNVVSYRRAVNGRQLPAR